MHRSLGSLMLVLAVASPAAAQLTSELVVSGLSRPLAFVPHPTRADVQLIVEQGGRIRVLENGALAGDFLDLTGQVESAGERGLLGLAFAPDFATSRRVFVCFTNTSSHTVIARYRQPDDAVMTLDASTRFDLMWPGGARFIVQPFSNHNGGHLAFGPDGYLYVGLGDGGSADDPMHLAQDRTTLLGKMLRLDVDVPDTDPEGYDVPPDNPFVGTPGTLPEIWAFGLRNPWRYTFDDPARGGTGALLIGDVGQGDYEEIDHEPAGQGGRNYGWRNREGAHPNVTTLPPAFLPLTDPVFEYDHGEGRSITGGYVYRGTALGAFYQGRYFFGDFIVGRVWSIALVADGTGAIAATQRLEHTAELGAGAASPASFGVDAGGELYVVNYGGTVHRIASTLPFDPDAIVQNGDFSEGLGPGGLPVRWNRRGTPSDPDVVVQVAGGVLEFRRSPAATTAVVFQNTGVPLPAGASMLATFELGNSDTIEKRIAVALGDQDNGDLTVCTLTLSPSQALREYAMRVTTGRAWTGLTISFAAETGGTGGFYQVDNVAVTLTPAPPETGRRVRPIPSGDVSCARRAVRR